MTLKDDTSEIHLYYIPTRTSKACSSAHSYRNIVYVTDLISPRGPIERSEATASVGELLRKYSINGALIAGGHATTVKQSDIALALAATKA